MSSTEPAVRACCTKGLVHAHDTDSQWYVCYQSNACYFSPQVRSHVRRAVFVVSQHAHTWMAMSRNEVGASISRVFRELIHTS